MTIPASNEGAFSSTAAWLIGLVDGPVVTTVAVLALAGLALRMMQGKLALRHLGAVVLGIFLAIESPNIARHLFDAGVKENSEEPTAVLAEAQTEERETFDEPKKQTSSAGASVFYP